MGRPACSGARLAGTAELLETGALMDDLCQVHPADDFDQRLAEPDSE